MIAVIGTIGLILIVVGALLLVGGWGYLVFFMFNDGEREIGFAILTIGLMTLGAVLLGISSVLMIPSHIFQ